MKYTTIKNKRVVYGGGGIMPDFFVPIDTTRYTEVHRNIIAKGIMNQFVITYFDENKKQLKKDYPTYEAYEKKFEVTDKILSKLKKSAEKEGITINDEQFDKSENLIKIQIKALLARDLFTMAEYFRVMNSQSETFKKALELINNVEEYNRLLGVRQVGMN